MARAYKHQEFLAHTGEINCLQIGRKSGRVLVTGGDDRKVNMWAIGKPHCIMSLTGHTSSVECVTFDTEEEVVVAGSAGGTLKLWDLEQQKVVRNMVGHRSNCVSVDFHPYGDFFASGSSDTNLKVWDVRRKSCISTYKGHTRAVTVIKFSPDGRWLCSGAEDGTVKLWDLAAGKLMQNFTAHEGPITCLDFHPTEYMLSTASTDRSIKFWDLETFSLISSADQHTTPIRSMTFSPDGSALLAGSHDALKVWAWEPVTSLDHMDVAWNKVTDMKIVDDQLIACGTSSSFVAVWVAEMSQIKPFGASVSEDVSNKGLGAIDVPVQPVVREAAPRELGPPAAARESPRVGKGGMAFEVPNPKAKDLPRVMPRPSSRPSSSDAPRPASGSSSSMPSQPNAENWQPGPPALPPPSHPPPSHPPPAHPPPSHPPPAARQLPAPPSYNALQSSESGMAGASQGNLHLNSATPPVPAVPSHLGADRLQPPAIPDSRGAAPDARIAAPTLPDARVRMPPRIQSPVANPPSLHMAPAAAAPPPVIPARRDSPLGLDIAAFLPGGAVANQMNDEEILAQTLDQHHSMCGILNNRLTITRAVYTLWAKGDFREAILLMSKMKDPAVAVDVLTHAQIKTAKDFTLDMAVDFLPLMQDLLASRFEDYIVVALETTNVILKGFSSLIKMTRAVAGASGPAGNRVEVDVAKEERLNKCNKCFSILQQIESGARAIGKHDGRVGTHAQELIRSFESAKLT